MKNVVPVKEGDIFEILRIDGTEFEIRYGYYEEFERENGAPLPIYPDFIKKPAYTSNGYPFITKMQEPCQYFEWRSDNYSEMWCGSCKYCPKDAEMITICQCDKKRLKGGTSI